MTGPEHAHDERPTVDPLSGAVGFVRALRDAGVTGGVDATTGYLAGLREIDLADSRRVYWVGRITLCRDPEDIPRYDLAFAHWFGGVPAGSARNGARPRQARAATLTPTADGTGDQDDDGDSLHVAASESETLRHRDIAELSAAERARLDSMIAELRVEPPRRKAVRRRISRTGEIDPHTTLRRMLAAGGEPALPGRRSRGQRPRRVVLLIDVSGSMRPYCDALLRFAHLVTHGGPTRRRTDTEVFSLGTRMTRLTRAMSSRDAELALAAAGRTVPDWAGGTRLGETLRVFLERWGRRAMARGATVVVFSDGWERGDARLLGTQMAQMRRLAHAVIWVNPHAGGASYRPVQSGIAAALPHVDRLLAGHSLATLQRLLTEVRDA